MESTFSAELDYKKVSVTVPKYQLSRVTQQSNGNTVTLSASGGETSQFELPSGNAFNFAKSYLTFDYAIPAAGAGLYNVAYYDTIPLIQQLSVYTRGGLFLCDIPNFAWYMKVVLNTDTRFDDVASAQEQTSCIELNNCNSGFSANSTIYDVVGGVPQYFTPSSVSGCGIRPSGGNTRGAPITGSNASCINVSFLEPLYIRQSRAANSLTNVNMIIPLSLIHNTILALDKDVYFNEILTLRIIWAPYTHAGYLADRDIDTTAANNVVYTNLAIPFNLTNLNLYLAVEQNQDITNALKTKVATGSVEYLTDYVYPQKQNYPAGGAQSSQSLSYKFNRAHGRKLKKIYLAPFDGNENKNVLFAHTNLQTIDNNLDSRSDVGTVVASYYTMLDNQRLQQFNIDCTNLDDWMIHQDLLRYSLILNSDVYQYNWCHIDNWDGKRTVEHSNNEESGTDLSYERKWDLWSIVTHDGPINWYTFTITSKMITVTPSGITIL